MFLLPLKQFANSGEEDRGGGGGAGGPTSPTNTASFFSAVRGNKEKIKNVNTRSLNAIPVLSRKAVDDDPELSFFLFLFLL